MIPLTGMPERQAIRVCRIWRLVSVQLPSPAPPMRFALWRVWVILLGNRTTPARIRKPARSSTKRQNSSSRSKRDI